MTTATRDRWRRALAHSALIGRFGGSRSNRCCRHAIMTGYEKRKPIYVLVGINLLVEVWMLYTLLSTWLYDDSGVYLLCVFVAVPLNAVLLIITAMVGITGEHRFGRWAVVPWYVNLLSWLLPVMIHIAIWALVLPGKLQAVNR